MKVDSLEVTDKDLRGMTYFNSWVEISCGSFKLKINFTDAAWAGHWWGRLKKHIEACCG